MQGLLLQVVLSCDSLLGLTVAEYDGVAVCGVSIRIIAKLGSCQDVPEQVVAGARARAKRSAAPRSAPHRSVYECQHWQGRHVTYPCTHSLLLQSEHPRSCVSEAYICGHRAAGCDGGLSATVIILACDVMGCRQRPPEQTAGEARAKQSAG